jgi:hypothetical protein
MNVRLLSQWLLVAVTAATLLLVMAPAVLAHRGSPLHNFWHWING